MALQERAFISDIAQILAAAGRGDISALAAILTGIEGDLLESMGDVSARFDDWLAIERPARRSQVVSESLACAEDAGMSAPEETQTVLRALEAAEFAEHPAAEVVALAERATRLRRQLEGAA